MAETTIQPPEQKRAERPQQAVPPRPKRTYWTYLNQSARMWARNVVDRDNLIASLKSLAWVAPMTVLIWIYAEREQTSKQPVQFHVVPRNNNPNRLVELSAVIDGRSTSNFTVRADLAGPNARLEHEKERLEGGAGFEVQIPDFPPGHHQIPLASLIVDDPTLKEEGLTPTNILPSQVDVFVDPIDTAHIPVRVPPSVKNLEQAASLKPDHIDVTGPRSVLTDAGAFDGRLVANVNLPNLNEPGAKSVQNAPVTLALSDSHVHWTPTTVSAEYTVTSPNVTGDLYGVPVLAGTPPNDPLWEKYKPVFDSPLSTLKVVGPAETIKEVNRPDYPDKPKIFLDLSKPDQPMNPPVVGRVYRAPLDYHFGSTGLTPAPDAPKTLEFTIAER